MAAAVRRLPTIAHRGTAAAMIAVATSQVGYREGSNNDTAFGRWYGMNHAAWCAIYISWAAALSGNGAVIPKHAWTPAGADWFRDRGRWGTKPRVGAIAYYYNPGMGRIAHVELVVRVYDDGSWLACGGNTNNTGSRSGNGVYLLRRATTRGGGFGYPAYKALPEPVRKAKAKAKVVRSSVTKLADGVEPGRRHSQVADVQRVLVAAGYGPIPGSVSTFYGANTAKAVRRFFEDHPEFASGPRDSALGPKGWAFLQKKAGRR
jgi:hypothetical protein